MQFDLLQYSIESQYDCCSLLTNTFFKLHLYYLSSQNQQSPV
jgi:hypothetical protein